MGKTYTTEVYPKNIYDNSTESVTVKIGEVEVGKITIGSDNVISDAKLNYDEGFNLSDKLTFTFDDRYCTEARYSNKQWTYTWSNNNTTATFKEECTVEELLKGTATLVFETNAY